MSTSTVRGVESSRGPAALRHPVTVRALVIGALLLPPNILWVQSMELAWSSGMPTEMSLFFNAVFTLTVLALLNVALRRFAPERALSPGELAVTYAMLCVGSAVAGHDFLQVLAVQIPTAAYYATPVNGWAELFSDLFASNVLVDDPRALSAFWEGDAFLYSSEAIRPWVAPIGTWLIFVFALVGTMLAIDVLVWRRWTEQEKLSYPLTDIPYELTRPGMGIVGPDLFGSRIFWIGFGLVAILDIVNGIGTLYPAIPTVTVTAIDISTSFDSYPWKAMGKTWISFYPFGIGLGYLMPQDFLFSAWFFYWFWKLELVASYMLGYQRLGLPFVREQTVGAYFGIAVFALWMGRHYFASVIGKVLQGRSPEDESRQALPYQVTLMALVALIAVMLSFMTRLLNVSLGAASIYIAGYLLLSVAITRMRAEFGLPVHDLFTGPFDMMVRIGGASTLGRENVKGLAMLWWVERVQRSHPMPHGIEGLALGDRRGVSGSGMIAAIGIAVVVGAFASFWATLHLAYTHGFATVPGDASYLGKGAFSRPASWLANPGGLDAGRLGGLIAGGVFTVALLLMRQRYVWWPFHPAGYAASSIHFIGLLWMPLFIAWAVKGVSLRYGGHRLYSRLMPFFMGLILGEFMVGGMWGLIGSIGRFPTYRFWAY